LATCEEWSAAACSGRVPIGPFQYYSLKLEQELGLACDSKRFSRLRSKRGKGISRPNSLSTRWADSVVPANQQRARSRRNTRISTAAALNCDLTHSSLFPCRAAQWYPCLPPTGWLRQKPARFTFAGEEITFSRMILTVSWFMAGT
jgi:hypothetical protein